jgi:hypothetical protein
MIHTNPSNNLEKKMIPDNKKLIELLHEDMLRHPISLRRLAKELKMGPDTLKRFLEGGEGQYSETALKVGNYLIRHKKSQPIDTTNINELTTPGLEKLSALVSTDKLGYNQHGFGLNWDELKKISNNQETEEAINSWIHNTTPNE